MAAYSLALRNLHNALQSALDGNIDVLLAHEPGRDRPYVVFLRHPRVPKVSKGFTFVAEQDVMAFMSCMYAEVAGTPVGHTPVEVVEHVPALVVEKPVGRRKAAAAATALAGADGEQDELDD